MSKLTLKKTTLLWALVASMFFLIICIMCVEYNRFAIATFSFSAVKYVNHNMCDEERKILSNFASGDLLEICSQKKTGLSKYYNKHDKNGVNNISRIGYIRYSEEILDVFSKKKNVSLHDNMAVYCDFGDNLSEYDEPRYVQVKLKKIYLITCNNRIEVDLRGRHVVDSRFTPYFIPYSLTKDDVPMYIMSLGG